MRFITNISNRIRCFSCKMTEEGSSLLDAVMGIAILSIGMLGTGSLALGIVRGNMVSKNLTAATTLAQEKMEGIKEIGYSGLPATNAEETEDYGTISYAASGGSTHCTETEPLPEYCEDGQGSAPGITADYSPFRRITSTEIDTPVAGMKTVTVRVYWRTGQIPTTLRRIFAE